TFFHVRDTYLMLTLMPPTEIHTLSLHDALPILPSAQIAPRFRQHITRMPALPQRRQTREVDAKRFVSLGTGGFRAEKNLQSFIRDRKSTRLNSSHLGISYAVFCLKKKKKIRKKK